MLYRQHWLLDPQVVYLNHGSFGATPIPVLEYQQELRNRLESQPVHFLARELETLLAQARAILGQFVGANPQDLAFLTNATEGVNTVLRSLVWQAEEEIILTNHTYNAVANAVRFLSERDGVKIKTAVIPFPLSSPEQMITPILEQVTPRTKLVILDHVSSSTALIFPIPELTAELNACGIDTLVDGAHAPGFLPLELESFAPAYYTGNCHKWLCAPKGAAFLYVRPDKQSLIRPLAISHGANAPLADRSRWQLEFAWTGTDDPTPFLSVPKAIAWLAQLFPQGWPQLQQHNQTLACQARQLICDTLSLPIPSPETMLGAMAAIPLPPTSLSSQEIYHRLLREFAIEIPVIPWENGKILIRLSAQVYNHLDQYQYLARALEKIL